MARSFVFKVRKEADSGDVASVAKRKKHTKRSDIIRDNKFITSVQQGLRMNADAYINVLEEVVKPWIEEVADGRPYVFQQDSTPAHTALKTQGWLAENFNDHVTPNIWPPSSPDLNPLDYYVWGVIERDTNKKPHNTKESLKTAVRTAMAEMNSDQLIRACSRFRGRIEVIIAADGGFIE